MNSGLLRIVRPLLIAFLVLTALAFATGKWMGSSGIDQTLVLAGNLLLFVVSLGAFWVMYRALQSSHPQAFIRAMYAGFIIKFFIVAIAAFVYIMVTGKAVNKPGLMLCAAIYIIYTTIETRILFKMLKSKKNA